MAFVNRTGFFNIQWVMVSSAPHESPSIHNEILLKMRVLAVTQKKIDK